MKPSRRKRRRSGRSWIRLPTPVSIVGLGLLLVAGAVVWGRPWLSRAIWNWRVAPYLQYPTDWISAVLNSQDPAGIDVTLDFARAEIIVESCRSPEYLDRVTGEPHLPPISRCQIELWGRIAGLSEGEFDVVPTHAGNPGRIKFSYSRHPSGRPVLKLALEGRSAELLPGKKNDLMQAFEALDSVRKEKEACIRKSLARPDSIGRPLERPPSH